MSSLMVLATLDALRQQVKTWKQQPLKVGFVPTMGYLHDGHLSLIHLALEHSDRVIVSVYVNPTQFGPNEDLDQYPRDLEGDQAKIEQAGAHALFYPDDSIMYPDNAQTFVNVKELSRPLCGEDRPVHFEGVATVVTKLFNAFHPDVAVFGEKDYQQLQLIRKMTQDLLFEVKIVGGAIVRESDGLAMSSRNAYLKPEQRKAATCLSRALRTVRQAYASGTHSSDDLLQTAKHVIAKELLAQPQYIELRNSTTLETVTQEAQASDRMFLAVRVGSTRLIDNAPLAGPCELD